MAQFCLRVAAALPSDPKRVFTILSTSSIEHALSVLSENNILSAPVVTEGGKALGFVDVLDVVAFLVEQELALPIVSDTKTTQFPAIHACDIIDKSKRDAYEPLVPEAPLAAAIQAFAEGIHRIPILSSEDEHKIAHVFTQTDLVKFLAMNVVALPGTMHSKTPRELGFKITEHKKDLVHVAPSTAAIEAFKLMHDKSLSAVAVLGEDEVLVGEIGAHDVRAILNEKDHSLSLASLRLPAAEFLDITKAKGSKGFVSCESEATLGEVLSLLGTDHVHRIYIVDSNTKAFIGVLSLTDIFAGILKAMLGED